MFLPRLDGELLSFHLVESMEGLIINKYGIPEPTAETPCVSPEEIDIFILPALGLDLNGNRLGSGKGYYDRTLKNIESKKLFGLCYKFQIVVSVPNLKHDKKVGYLIYEDGIWDCESNKEVEQ